MSLSSPSPCYLSFLFLLLSKPFLILRTSVPTWACTALLPSPTNFPSLESPHSVPFFQLPSFPPQRVQVAWRGLHTLLCVLPKNSSQLMKTKTGASATVYVHVESGPHVEIISSPSSPVAHAHPNCDSMHTPFPAHLTVCTQCHPNSPLVLLRFRFLLGAEPPAALHDWFQPHLLFCTILRTVDVCSSQSIRPFQMR